MRPPRTTSLPAPHRSLFGGRHPARAGAHPAGAGGNAPPRAVGRRHPCWPPAVGCGETSPPGALRAAAARVKYRAAPCSTAGSAGAGVRARECGAGRGSRLRPPTPSSSSYAWSASTSATTSASSRATRSSYLPCVGAPRRRSSSRSSVSMLLALHLSFIGGSIIAAIAAQVRRGADRCPPSSAININSAQGARPG